MRPWERRLFNAASVATAISGFVYFAMKYFMAADDPFALVNHPWQNVMLSAHLIIAPALLIMFGVIFNSHVMRKIGASRMPNRKTGLTSLATFTLMTLSGYLLQTTTSETLLQSLVVVHVATGTLFSASYVVHVVISWRLARRSRAIAAIGDVA